MPSYKGTYLGPLGTARFHIETSVLRKQHGDMGLSSVFVCLVKLFTRYLGEATLRYGLDYKIPDQKFPMHT